MKHFIIILLFCSGAALAAEITFDDREKLDIKAYTGLWYEFARTPNRNQDKDVKKDGKEYSRCYETTAEYTLDDEDTLKIHNIGKRYTKDGQSYADEVHGYANVLDKKTGRKLGLAFGGGFARFFQRLISGGGFSYWIYRLGPKNADGKYSWSIVSGPKRNFIFILARQREISEEIKVEILAAAKEDGLPIAELLYLQQAPPQ